MICVSVGGVDYGECLAMVQGFPFAEIRMDRIRMEMEDVRRLFSSHRNLIATFRETGHNKEKRKEYLLEAIRSGARYVDIEIDAEEGLKKEIMREAKERGAGLILSFHDFQSTPKEEELRDIAIRCLREGADYAKIACKVERDRDALSLLRLVLTEGLRERTIVVGMGEKGKIVRILAPLFGSPFTYACPKDGLETADGQIEFEVLGELLRLLRGGI
jgi:3-dehydroquinate dehydratase type I